MYVIIGRYQGTSEVIDEAATLGIVRYLIQEYRLAYGPSWSISYRRKRATDD